MTGDSDDVSVSADKKPKGSLVHPPTSPEELRADETTGSEKAPVERTAHLTGEEQAQRNREADPPA